MVLLGTWMVMSYLDTQLIISLDSVGSNPKDLLTSGGCMMMEVK